jgi:hypothetical protein
VNEQYGVKVATKNCMLLTQNQKVCGSLIFRCTSRGHCTEQSAAGQPSLARLPSLGGSTAFRRLVTGCGLSSLSLPFISWKQQIAFAEVVTVFSGRALIRGSELVLELPEIPLEFVIFNSFECFTVNLIHFALAGRVDVGVLEEPRQPGVYQKEHADGKDEHELASEEPKVQVKISNESVKSPSHSAKALSEFEDPAKSSP